MVKFKCSTCGKEEKHVKKKHKHKHKVIERDEHTAECLECDTVFEIPNCCDKKMYVAS